MKIRLFILMPLCMLMLNSLGSFSQAKEQKIENIYSFAKLYGYVRYFYPGDESASLDWNKFFYYGIKKVEKAKNPTELETILNELYLPIAPGIEIFKKDSKRKINLNRIIPKDTVGLKIITWQYYGYTERNHYLYSNLRTNRSKSGRDTIVNLFPDNPEFGSYFVKDIGNELSCFVPLALYSISDKTFPQPFKDNFDELISFINQSSEDTLDEKYIRFSALVKCWNVLKNFYPYFKEVGLDWEAELYPALAACYEIKDTHEFTRFLEKLTAKLKDGHVEVASKIENWERFLPPFSWRWVENNIIISETFDESIPVKKGDIIIEINDLPALDFLERKEQYYSASTNANLRNQTLNWLLWQKRDTEWKLKIKNKEGQFETVILKHN